MKTAFRSASWRPLALTFLLAIGSAVSSRAGDAQPALPLKRAVDLAEQTLVDKGVANEVFAQSVVLKRATLTSAKSFWEIAWSSPIAGSKPGSQEVGVQVTMAGDVIHLIKGRGELHRVPPPR